MTTKNWCLGIGYTHMVLSILMVAATLYLEFKYTDEEINNKIYEAVVKTKVSEFSSKCLTAEYPSRDDCLKTITSLLTVEDVPNLNMIYLTGVLQVQFIAVIMFLAGVHKNNKYLLIPWLLFVFVVNIIICFYYGPQIICRINTEIPFLTGKFFFINYILISWISFATGFAFFIRLLQNYPRVKLFIKHGFQNLSTVQPENFSPYEKLKNEV